MTLSAGARLGPYEIGGIVGAGGMGEVYRAYDPRLARPVAIKILPPSFAADPMRRQRFEREAQAIGALNHPNIVAVYDVGMQDAAPYLVTELLEGQTLRDRLATRLPVPLAIDYGARIAEGLAVAHTREIFHRDLKPENVFITRQGRVKILDFGLAKSPAVSREGMTETAPDWQYESAPGTVVGTVGYMSPEQLLGKPIDHRSDIFSLGVVLFEMVVGTRPFQRESGIETMHAIVHDEPPAIAAPDAGIPRAIGDIVHRCLAKDPEDRFQSSSDLAFALRSALLSLDERFAGRSAPRDARSSSWWRRNGLAAASVALFVLGIGAAFLWTHGRSEAAATQPVARTAVVLPAGERLTAELGDLPLAVSPDGRRIAYVANQEGHARLFLRELGALEPTAVQGTDGARHPFFSPDGQWVGFFADSALQRVAITGGAPLRICDVPARTLGASWGVDNTIVFAVRGSDLLRVDAAGGTPQALTGSRPAAWPEILPDGKTVLFTTGNGGPFSAIATMPLAGGPRHLVARLADSPLEGGAVIGSGGTISQARFVSSGHLVYGQAPGIVRASRFDLDSLSLKGPAVSVVSSVERALQSGGVYFAVSQTGLLVYASTGDKHQLVWVDRNGTSTPISGDRASFRIPNLSPDGKLVAVAVNDETRRSDVWVYDAERGTKRRLTTEAHNLESVWTPDGTHISLSHGPNVVELPALGSGAQAVLLRREPGQAAYPSSWSPDGHNLLYFAYSPDGLSSLWVLPRGADGTPRPIPARPGINHYAQFSPNGRWLAYASDESGSHEVYVGRFPDLGDKVVVSKDGGTRPRWSRDGRELFYRQGDALMAVPVDMTTTGFRAGRPQRLFEGPYSGASQEPAFDVSPDGRRFVMVKSDDASSRRQLTVVFNWFEDLKE